jgi:hypothetical protein
VSGGAAGTRFTCGCGREVAVPSLHVLRKQAGEAVLGPELLIEAALRAGDLPSSPCCARCGEVTPDYAIVSAECERARVRESGWVIHPLALLFGWLVINRPGPPRVLGRDLIFRLPLRVCDGCFSRLRSRDLRKALAREPLYRQLLDKYPHAGLSLSRE